MAQQQRTRAAILALLADNVTGQISAEDLRDFMVTVMEEEFVNGGDFWSKAMPRYVTTDRTGKGWKQYSQVMISAVSFGNVVALNSTGQWYHPDPTDSTENRVLGLAMESYAAAESQAIVLRQGVIMHTLISNMLSDKIGYYLYLDSTTSDGSVTTTFPTVAANARVVGIVEHSGESITYTNKIRFDPDWSISGT